MRGSDRVKSTRLRTSCCPRYAPGSAGMSNNRADPGVLVIFGASGDLARRKLLPAIYNLAEDGLLPEPFAILGIARPEGDTATFRAAARERVAHAEGEPLDPAVWNRI